MSNDAPAITDSQDITLSGHAGDLVGRYWLPTDPQWIAVLCHGYGEHIGRYDWVARTLNEAGAAVYGADHADRKSTRLNSSHVAISYAGFCLKKKKKKKTQRVR